MIVYEIRLQPKAQTLKCDMFGYEVNLRLIYAGEAGWVLDIHDTQDMPLICGIPLVTGVDLLAPYASVGLDVILYVETDGDPDAVPTYENLGIGAHLYVVPKG